MNKLLNWTTRHMLPWSSRDAFAATLSMIVGPQFGNDAALWTVDDGKGGYVARPPQSLA